MRTKPKNLKLIRNGYQVGSVLRDGRSKNLYYFAIEELAAYFPLLENRLGQVGLVDADQVPDEFTEIRVANRMILKLALSYVLHFHDAVIDAIL